MQQSACTESASARRPFFMEHRWGQRITCRAAVQLSAGKGIGGAGNMRDVSSSGAFIETAVDLPVYARLALSVMGNEPARDPVEIAATVVRVERDGVGVEWCDTPAGSVCSEFGCTTRCGAHAPTRK